MGMEALRTVLITGASGGIGRALARGFASPDTRLALTGRDAERLAGAAAECRARGAEVETEIIDLAIPDRLEEWIAAVDSRHGIDIAVGNAGISTGVIGDRATEDVAVVAQVMNINFLGAVRTVTPLAESMRARGRGRLALIGSLAGLYPVPSCPAYSASKAALRSFAEACRANLRGSGVSVTLVSPGFVASPMSDQVRGPKPLMMDADRAAARIIRAIERGDGHVYFPRLLGLGLRALPFLPCALADRLIGAFDFDVEPRDR